MPPRLGELLVKEGACTPTAVREALQNQIIFGGRIGTNLLELGAVTEEALARALGRRFGVPSLFGDIQVEPGAVALLRPEVADRYDVVPYVVADRKLALLAIDPGDLVMLDEVAFVTGKAVHPIVVPEARLWALLKTTYGVERQLRGLDVDFATLRDGAGAAAATAAPRASLAGDLMGEADFDAIYAKTAPYALTPAAPAAPAARAPPPPPPPDDAVIELTDLLEPEPPPAPPPLAVPALTRELIETLYGRAGHAPPPAPVARPPAPPPPEPEPSPLSFDEAVRLLQGVQDRSSIAHTVLRYARSKYRRAVLLTVNRGVAHGWAGLGERLGAREIRRLRIPLDTPGIVDTVVRTQAHLLGPIPKTEANIRLLKQLGGGVPANAFLVPILALGRVVNVFYVDAGKGQAVDASAVGELLILATRIAKSYDALLSRVR